MGWFDDLKNVNIGGGGVNLNPFASSIYTGKGTPWGEGPQDPYQPQYRQFDPNNYKGFDSSGLAAALRQQIGANTARSTSRLQGMLQGAGGGGADAAAGLAALQGEQGAQENTLQAQLARQDWEDRLGQWQAENQNEQSKANRDLERYGRETAGRAAPWQALGQIGGKVAGSFGGNLASKL